LSGEKYKKQRKRERERETVGWSAARKANANVRPSTCEKYKIENKKLKI